MQPVSPVFINLCPVITARTDNMDNVGTEEDESVDPALAMMNEPIIGVDRVVYDDVTGPGAIPANPLPTPKTMTALQRSIHDLTHLPYDPGCEI